MKLVHLADTHLGYRAYGRITPKGLNIRERDVIKTFKEALDKIAEINPELIIVAGDVFHRPRPGNTSIYLTIKFLLEFRTRCKAPIVMISGNHEASKTLENENILKIIEATVPLVKVIDRQIEQFTLDNLGVSILGIPYNALNDFDKTSIVPDSSYKYNILTIHGSFQGIKSLENEADLISTDDINASKWDYVALGHYHSYTKLADNVFYAGSIERTSSNIWREADEPKGFIEYNLNTGKHVFHKLQTPRNVVDTGKVDVNGLTAEEIDRVIERVVAQIEDFDNSMVRITLENIDNLSIKNLDYAKIGIYRKRALHFRLNFQKKEDVLEGKRNLPHESRDLLEYIDEDLKNFELAAGLNREKFEQMAKSYLVTGGKNV
ncbi:MAG: exonuclease SbcCD subunit D [Candidatus Gastranaerophilales bacterium]|nr:exonuclease SbcCD subunit D [Candidatus Gastranaerophilales bacterium]